jgi:hypothetical protein
MNYYDLGVKEALTRFKLAGDSKKPMFGAEVTPAPKPKIPEDVRKKYPKMRPSTWSQT